MCGRFAAGDLTQRQMAEIMEHFLYGTPRIDDADPGAKSGYHIRPTDLVTIAVSEEGGFTLSSAKWQMRPGKGARAVINARIENTAFWARYWQQGRCIIPAIGYYEWAANDGRKEPHFITVKRNAPLLFFAGFYGRSSDGRLSCSILTRQPSEQIASLHPRMPVIMSADQLQDWLTYRMTQEAAVANLGTDWDGRFEIRKVAPITSDSEGPEMIEPYEPTQGSFDF